MTELTKRNPKIKKRQRKVWWRRNWESVLTVTSILAIMILGLAFLFRFAAGANGMMSK